MKLQMKDHSLFSLS